MPVYTAAPEVEKIAQRIINTTRPILGHVKISYMFRPEAPVSDGKVTGGMCIRVDDRNRTIHDHDFIIEISKDIWDEATDQFKEALVDHELGHVGIRMSKEDGAEDDPIYDETTNRPKTFIRKHDIEEFEDVLERHGAFHKGLRDFLDAFARGRSKEKKTTKKTNEDNLTNDISETEDTSDPVELEEPTTEESAEI